MRDRRIGLFWKLFAGLASLSLLTALLVGLIAIPRLIESEEEWVDSSLVLSTSILEGGALDALQGGDADALQMRLVSLPIEQDVRLTVIRRDGVVLADTDHDPQEMNDHSERPEVVASLTEDYGRSTRFSDTLRTRMRYVARRVARDGEHLGWVRASRSLGAIDERTAALRDMVISAALLAVLVSLLLALYISRRLTRPLRSLTSAVVAIARGDYERRVPADASDEIGRLAGAFNRMAEQLRERVATISRDRRELRAMLAGMQEGVLAMDREERVVLMNVAAGRILDADPESDVGRQVWEVTRLREVGEALTSAVRQGRPEEREVRLTGAPRDRFLQLHAAPIGTRDGPAQGAVLVLHDITDLRYLEKIRRDFVANVSHELKTPLAAIRGFTETILEDEAMDPETRRKFLERVRHQSIRLAEMVEEVLMLSRLESDSESVPLQPIDLGTSVRESLHALAPQAEAAGVSLESRLPDEPARVLGSEESLRRIVGNLLDNAVKYTPDGGQVWVRVHVTGGSVVLEVEDNGIGIPVEARDRVFERFYRVDPGRSRAKGGTGLGLSIVKHLVQALGGEVGVDASSTGGSIFRVCMRLAESTSEEPNAPSAT